MPKCADCGQDNPEGARFCLACGAQLDAPSPERTEERRVVTVLFVDMVGSTSRAEKLDPEDVREILDRYYRRVKQEVEHFGGVVEKFIGDAVMAALNAADPELDLNVRIAVNTGEALVALGTRPAHGEAMVAGDVVNTAARLQASAPVN